MYIKPDFSLKIVIGFYYGWKKERIATAAPLPKYAGGGRPGQWVAGQSHRLSAGLSAAVSLSADCRHRDGFLPRHQFSAAAADQPDPLAAAMAFWLSWSGPTSAWRRSMRSLSVMAIPIICWGWSGWSGWSPLRSKAATIRASWWFTATPSWRKRYWRSSNWCCRRNLSSWLAIGSCLRWSKTDRQKNPRQLL